MTPSGNNLVLGRLTAGGQPVTLSAEARGKHLYVVGATGTGKSKFLEGLIRQDIEAWPHSQCGLMVLDPHGSLFDNVTEWLAANDLHRWPVVPIDLRRKDWVISYNLLRRRGEGDPAVVVGEFARAIVHAWGQGRMDETPRLAKWLRTILCTLYENECTLAEAMHLIRSPQVRGAMTENVQDLLTRTVWDTARALPPRDFHEEVSSTVNRIVRFLSTQVVRASLCQTEHSLDLSAALDEGAIILVSLATEGTQIDDEDAATFGSILLSDLWTAARARGKRDGVRPFYCYLDEFQTFLTPAMATTLDQSRGFGLHMTLCHQFPSQLAVRGDEGRIIFESVMANARSKVCFQLEHPEDLPTMALWLARHEVDLDEVKHELYATKVVGHTLEYLPGYGSSDSVTRGEGTSETDSVGFTHTLGTNWSHTDSQSETLSVGHSEGGGVSYGTSVNWGRSEGHTDGTSEDEGWSETQGSGEASSWGSSRGESAGTSSSSGESESVSLGLSGSVYDRERDVADDGELEDLDFRKKYEAPDGLRQSISVSAGTSRQTSESHGTQTGQSVSASASRSASSGRSGSRGRSRGRQSGTSSGEAASESDSRSWSDTASEAQTTGSSDTYGGSESWAVQEARALGRSKSLSVGKTQSTTLSPVLLPVMGKELSGVQFRSVEEQLFRFTQVLSGQPDRHCVVRLAGQRRPLALVTRTVSRALTTEGWVDEWLVERLRSIPFAIPMAEALEKLGARERDFPQRILAAVVDAEPACSGRPLPAAAPGQPAPQVRRATVRRRGSA